MMKKPTTGSFTLQSRGLDGNIRLQKESFVNLNDTNVDIRKDIEIRLKKSVMTVIPKFSKQFDPRKSKYSRFDSSNSAVVV